MWQAFEERGIRKLLGAAAVSTPTCRVLMYQAVKDSVKLPMSGRDSGLWSSEVVETGTFTWMIIEFWLGKRELEHEILVKIY
jgi:hypothetical protein